MKRKLLLVAAVLLVCSSTFALLADQQAFSWARGDAGTTYQMWDFLSAVPNQGTVGPDASWSDGLAPASLTYYPGNGQHWLAGWGGQVGVLPFSGASWLLIPNYDNNNPYKDIYVQIVWATQTPGAGVAPSVDVVGLDGQAISPVLSAELVGDAIDLGATGEVQYDIFGNPYSDIWYLSIFKIRLEPNPASEIIRVAGSINVDSIIVDTICVPEPATMVLVGLGGLLLRKRR